MTAPQHADDFTELVDADIPRVDLVGKAANGTTFLMRKAADDGLTQPLIAPDQVRALLAKADAQEGDTVTTPEGADVAKADTPVDAGDLIEDAPGGGTADSLPGSPDWEQLDGDTAMNAVATLARVKACLAWLSDREAQEAVTGDDPGDGENAWDLDDMACQIDCIIGRLAGFAVGEHLDAGMADELEEVGKAVAKLAGPLAVVEKLAPIRKAGRVLSSANEQAIRTAVDSLTGVLNSLPQAPAAAADDTAVTKTEETPVANVASTITVDIKPRLVAADGEPIEKGADLAAELLKDARSLTAVDAFRALLAGGQKVDVTKAKGDPQMAVFDAAGKLVGVIDPADLNPIADTAPPEDAPAAGDDAPAEPAAEAPAEPAAAPAAEPTEKVIPGTATVQAPPAEDDTQTPAVAKTADTATLAEDRDALSKQVQSLESEIEVLKETVRKYGLQPDDRNSPVLNGGTGTPGAAARDTTADSPLADVLKAIEAEPDPVKRDELRKAAFFAGVKARFEQA